MRTQKKKKTSITVVDKTLTPSPWNTPMDYPCGLRRWRLVIRVKKLSESSSILENWPETRLVDSLNFLTLITKLQGRSPFYGSPYG